MPFFAIFKSHFYPRSPCGERPTQGRANAARMGISIHALLAESDDTGPRQRGPDGHFYPRSPCGERPPAGKVRPWASHISIHALLAESDGLLTHNGHPQYISIHALLAESDNRGWCNTMAARRISIHALLAESDRHWQMGHSLTRQFLSTLSLRRATFAALYDILKLFPISIHALLAESDLIVSLLVSMSY